jgi:hypothetical protein
MIRFIQVSEKTVLLAISIVCLTYSEAEAEPNPNAIRPMRTAFRSCKKAMDKGGANQRDQKDYLSYRDTAIQRDPSIKTWSGTIDGDQVDEMLRKCDAFFSQQASRASDALPQKEAQDLMYKAFDICFSELFRPGTLEKTQKAWNRYQELRDKAIAADPKIQNWDGRIKGQIVNKRIVECNEKIKQQLDAATKQVAASKKVQEERRLQNIKEDEEKRKKFQMLLQSLSGDRRRIMAEEGHEPSDYKGNLRTSPEWKYTTYPSNVGPHWHCTTTYVFRGDKLVRKNRRGPYCR